MTTERISFMVGLPPVALRRNRETRSSNYRAALVRQYQEEVWCAANRCSEYDRGRWVVSGEAASMWAGLPWEKAHLVLTWRHHRAGPDVDNALASCKWLIDVLKATGPRPLGIIKDDDPRCLTVRLSTEKVQRKQDEGVLVEVERR